MDKGNDSPDGDIFGAKGGIHQFIRLSAVRAKPDPRNDWEPQRLGGGSFAQTVSQKSVRI